MRLWLIVAAVMLLRLPFLNQPIQGDDVYYLQGAKHAQIDPAHPHHARYVFQGDLVDMRGHPHPPFNAWFLGILIAIFGEVREVPFHAAYILFSLITALAMYSVARRYSPQPLAATLLFIATPTFVVNGASLESDLPFLAFWMASIALFLRGWLGAAAVAMLMAAMTSYQAIVLTPILWAYLWFERRDWRAGYLVALTPVAVFAGWQILERLTSGAMPAQVLAGYFTSYGLQQLSNKVRNAVALTAHAGWLVFPALAWTAFRDRWPVALVAAAGGALIDPHPLFWASFATGALIIAWCIGRTGFPAAWVLLFFTAALVLFFAGSARYLLPIAAPVALLASRQPIRFVAPAIAAQIVVSLGLAVANYGHWDGYRRFVATISQDLDQHRSWANAEWGLRFYLEDKGAVVPLKTQAYRPGDVIVRSELASQGAVTTGGGQLVEIASASIVPALPLRLIGLDSRSGYSTASQGLRPFDISNAPVDRVRADVVIEREPTLSWLAMDSEDARFHIVSGVYERENTWRWISGEAVFALRPPGQPGPIEVEIFIPDLSPVRRLRVTSGGVEIADENFKAPGAYTIRTRPAQDGIVALHVDKTFSPPGDRRDLGLILRAIGWR